MEKAEGITIIGGDFNLILDKDKDTTAPLVTQMSRDKKKKKIKEMMVKHQLVDIWRALHPVERDFTFHSKVHDTYQT